LGMLIKSRIVTEFPIFTKTDKLYSETGWITLSSRRHNRKLQLFNNIKNGHAPNYLPVPEFNSRWNKRFSCNRESTKRYY
jgi:hypothetical protein